MPKMSQYPAASTAADADIMILAQGGATKKIALSVLKAYMGGSGLLNNLEGEGAPGTEDDSASGYSIGSYWIDISGSPREAYRCVDATEGAAIWLNTTLEIAELGTAALVNMQAPTAENDIPVGSVSPTGSWIRKTLAQFKAILGWDTKADKVTTSPDPDGHLAVFDENGNLEDYGATPAELIAGLVASEDFTTIVKCTQAEYDALSPVDENTLYIVSE